MATFEDTQQQQRSKARAPRAAGKVANMSVFVSSKVQKFSSLFFTSILLLGEVALVKAGTKLFLPLSCWPYFEDEEVQQKLPKQPSTYQVLVSVKDWHNAKEKKKWVIEASAFSKDFVVGSNYLKKLGRKELPAGTEEMTKTQFQETFPEATDLGELTEKRAGKEKAARKRKQPDNESQPAAANLAGADIGHVLQPMSCGTSPFLEASRPMSWAIIKPRSQSTSTWTTRCSTLKTAPTSQADLRASKSFGCC